MARSPRRFQGLLHAPMTTSSTRFPCSSGSFQGQQNPADRRAEYPAASRSRTHPSSSLGSRATRLAVLDAVAQAANWQPKVAASKLSNANLVAGRGIAFGSRGNSGSATLAAAVADIEVNKQTGKIVAKHIYTAQDYGLVTGPDLVTSQAMGQVMHATSRTLVEEVTFDKGVTSLDWVSYPSLRFKDHPQHTHVVINRPDQGTGPSSEELLSPVHAALANAFFDATGVRIRQAPMTPGRVRATLAAAKAGTYK